MCENHYAIVARLKIFYVSNYKISITLLCFPKCRGLTNVSPIAKLRKRVGKKFVNEYFLFQFLALWGAVVVAIPHSID